MRTYTLKEAASFLKIHPDTLRERALKGTIPGAKIGKAWVFIEDDIARYLRSQYASQAIEDRQGLNEVKEVRCQSLNGVVSIGSGLSHHRAKGYADLLGLPTKR
jgi:excisionase family DNA binding protein